MPELQPHFDEPFQCIGPECDDLCCRIWNVFLDKDTYDKYQATPGLRPTADKYVKRLSDDPAESCYAKLSFPGPEYTCPFLSEERWCNIHKDYGAAYQPPICNSYPRVQQLGEGVTQNPLDLSCPEAARRVLLQPNFVPVERNSGDDRPKLQRFLRMAEQPSKTFAGVRKQYSLANTFALLLLQDRAYPLWQRLFLLGIFSKRLTEIYAAKQVEVIPALFTEYAGIVRSGQLRPAMDGIPLQAAAQLGAVIQVAHRLQNQNAVFDRMQNCIRDFMSGIRYSPNLSIEGMAPAYTDAHDRYFQPFFEQHPQILENYVSHYIVRTIYPRGPIPPGEPNTPLTAYFLLCLQFAVIKGLLIGMAGHYKEALTLDHVIKLIQSFSKQVEHDARFLAGLNRNLETTQGFALLLKN